MFLLHSSNEKLYCADINTTWSTKCKIIMYARSKNQFSIHVRTTGFRISNIQLIKKMEDETFIQQYLLASQEWKEELESFTKITSIFAKKRGACNKEAMFIICTENKSHAEQIITERNSWEVIDAKAFYLNKSQTSAPILNLVITSIINFFISFFK